MAQAYHKGLPQLGQLLLELVLVMPAILIIAASQSPAWSNIWLWMLIVAGSALMGFGIQAIFRLKKEGLWLIVFLMCAAIFYISTDSPDRIHHLTLSTISYIAFARGFKVVSSQKRALAFSMIYAGGLAGHAFLFLVSMFREEWRQLQPLLAVFGMIALCSVIFLLNRKQLGQANYSDMNHVSVPAYVMRMNRRYVMIFIGAVFLLATLLFSSMMDRLWRIFRDRLNAFLSKENEPLQEPVIDRPESSLDLMPALDEQLPAPIWIWLEKIFGATVVIVLIGLAIFLLVRLFRNLIQRWFPRLCDTIRRLLNQERLETADMDYEDEHFSLLQWEKLKNELKSPLHNLFRRKRRKPERMNDYHTNRERIRFLYRSRVREAEEDGYESQLSLTPRETLTELAERSANPEEKERINQLSSLYNMARYSKEEIRDKQLQTLLQDSRPKK